MLAQHPQPNKPYGLEPDAGSDEENDDSHGSVCPDVLEWTGAGNVFHPACFYDTNLTFYKRPMLPIHKDLNRITKKNVTLSLKYFSNPSSHSTHRHRPPVKENVLLWKHNQNYDVHTCNFLNICPPLCKKDTRTCLKSTKSTILLPFFFKSN